MAMGLNGTGLTLNKPSQWLAWKHSAFKRAQQAIKYLWKITRFHEALLNP